MDAGGRTRTLDLAYYVWGSTVTDFEATYGQVAEAGIRSIVIDAKRGNFSMESRDDVAKAKRILARLGMAAPACHGLCQAASDLTEEDPVVRDRMLRGHLNLMENAAELGGRTYVIHVGFGTWQEAEQRRAGWDRVRRALDQLAPMARELGMALALENGFTANYIARDAEDLASFLADYACPDVGACYDSGHAHIMEGVVPVLETLAPHVVTAHLHDNDGKEDQHLIPGQGTVVWPAMVAVLGRCPRLRHIETEAANCKEWAHCGGRDPWSLKDVHARYCEILNAPGSGISCR